MLELKKIDINDLRKGLTDAEKMKGEEKLGAMHKLRTLIQVQEIAYMQDFSRPFGCLTEIRGLLPVVEGSINRLESAKRKREARKGG